MSTAVALRDAVVVSGGFPLLAGVSLEIPAGAGTLLVGPNGAGKTSLLRLIGGLERLAAGSGSVLGHDLRRGNARDLRRRVGWLGHDGSFYDDLSARENLLFAAAALERPRALVDEALERVGLASRATTRARRLSAGQRRRLAIAWLVVRRAELWLLDEPYAALDDDGRSLLDGLLVEVVAAGATVVASAHDPLRSAAIATTVRLGGGRVLP